MKHLVQVVNILTLARTNSTEEFEKLVSIKMLICNEEMEFRE